jgi:hypothetical protein
MNPFMEGPVSQANNSQNLPTFKEYAWDFNKNRFIYNSDGTHTIVTEKEAIKVWVFKCLQTERYRFLAYFDDYGCELEPFIGKPNDGTEQTELYRYIEEALLVNPYIKRVDAISIETDHKKITMHLSLSTVYGDSKIRLEV